MDKGEEYSYSWWAGHDQGKQFFVQLIKDEKEGLKGFYHSSHYNTGRGVTYLLLNPTQIGFGETH